MCPIDPYRPRSRAKCAARARAFHSFQFCPQILHVAPTPLGSEEYRNQRRTDISLWNHSPKTSTNPRRVAHQECIFRAKSRVVLQEYVLQAKCHVVLQAKSRVVLQAKNRVVLQAQECRVPPQQGAQNQAVSPNQRLPVISPPGH